MPLIGPFSNLVDPVAGALSGSLQSINGDIWVLANATWDGADFHRIDQTKAAYGYQIQGQGFIPGEPDLGFLVSGATLWVAQPESYTLIRATGSPTGAVFGSVGGWELGWTLSQQRQMTVGGGGIEIDGYGTTPYTRVVANTTGSVLKRHIGGMVRNAFTALDDADDRTKESWFWGYVDQFTTDPSTFTGGTNHWAVAYIPANTWPASSSFDEYLTVGPSGIVEVSADPTTTNGVATKHYVDTATAGTATHNIPVLNVVSDYSANNLGTAPADTAINDAITDAIAAGGAIIYFPAGIYRVNSTLTCHTTVPIYFQGAGRWLTTIKYYGTGDCLRVYDSSTYSARTQHGGGVLGLTINGSNATGSGAAGLHMGDIFQYRLDLGVQNFAGTGGIGVWLDNQNYWAEQLHGQIYTSNCTTGVQFDNASGAASTSSGSFGRADLIIDINQGAANNDGVALVNGAFVYDGDLRIRGNFNGSSSALTSAVLRLNGSTPGGITLTSNSCIFGSRLHVAAECTSGAFTPQTIFFGARGASGIGTAGTNTIQGCGGNLDFSANGYTFTPSNIGTPPTSGALWFWGGISGDAALSPLVIGSPHSSPFTISSTTLYNQAYASSSGALHSYTGDFFRLTLSANTTITLGAEFSTTPGAPQRLTVILTQASSASYTVTWPASGSPTTAAPNVVWPGGTAPVMTATHNAVDVYHLETIDGATWFGQAFQATAPAGSTPAVQSVTTSGTNTYTLAAATYGAFNVTLGASSVPTFDFTGASGGSDVSFTVVLTQPSGGGVAVTWGSTITWIGGTAPVLNTGTSAVSIFVFESVDGSTWIGSMVTGPQLGSAATTAVAIGTSAGESTIASVTIPANLPAQATYRITAYGTITVGGTGGTTLMKTRLGGLSGTQVQTFTSASLTSSNTYNFRAVAEVTIQSPGSSGTWAGDLTAIQNIQGSAASVYLANPATATVNSTTAQVFALTLTLSSTTSTASCTGSVCERVA